MLEFTGLHVAITSEDVCPQCWHNMRPFAKLYVLSHCTA